MATAYRAITPQNPANLDPMAANALVRGQPIQITNAPTTAAVLSLSRCVPTDSDRTDW